VQADGAGRPETTVAMGGSSGGWAVLGLLTSAHADLVAGGVAAYPVTDLIELAERSHRFEAHYTDTLVAPRHREDVLRERSMSGRAGQVRRPLLLLHGTDDPVVPVEGTVVFADAARRAGADVELHLFEGEGHGFSDPANQLREYELITNFLARVVPDGDEA
jgi:dipeptidyl aminopeptidase/acylaminoacyl peptidase